LLHIYKNKKNKNSIHQVLYITHLGVYILHACSISSWYTHFIPTIDILIYVSVYLSYASVSIFL